VPLVRDHFAERNLMQIVKIETEYQGWIDDQVVRAFEGVGVKITKPARTMLAYVMQSQMEEGIVNQDSQLFQLANDFLGSATDVYIRMYGSHTMTINRAIHLLVQTNLRFNVFPWGTSD
jgi:hypothetical protein